MTCEGVRELLPEYAEGELDPGTGLAVHLTACAACRSELSRYRELLASLASLEEAELEPHPGLLERMLATVPPAMPAERLRTIIRSRPAAYALASLGGVAVGAMAIGILWWRAAHRAVRGEGRAPAVILKT